VNVRRRSLTLRFDEVVSERPASSNATTLADLVIVSPRDGQPRVDWGRDQITVHPHRPWRPNTAYTVSLLPGLADLRGNIRTAPTEVTFSTGPTIPPTLLHGHVFDAITGAPSGSAFVEARPTSDSTLVFFAPTDSLGAFHIRGALPGTYRVRGWVDLNRTRGVSPSDPLDSLTVTLRDTANVELLTFVHDSAGPRLGSVHVVDSITVDAIFDTPLGATPAPTALQFVLTGPDSARVPIRAVAGVPDTAAAPAVPAPTPQPPTAVLFPARGRRRLPPAHPVVVPKPTRPLLFRRVRITLAAPLRPGTRYRLHAVAVRGPTGHVATSDQLFMTPTPPAPGAGAPKPARE